MTVLLRHMPNTLHRQAKVLAAIKGITLERFIIAAVAAAVKKGGR